MSTNKVKQQVRPSTKVRKINKIAQADTGRFSRSEGLISFYATVDLPVATKLPDGFLAFDSTVAKLKITSGGVWVLAA